MLTELEESGNELKEQYPDDSKTVENFIRALKEACRARYKKALDGNVEPMKAEARFFLAEDRMCAYACLLRPENGGDDITLEEFLSRGAPAKAA